jgi:hypothetical protein
MQGLGGVRQFVRALSVHEFGAVGDERNALVLLDLEVAGGPVRRRGARPVRAAVLDRLRRQDRDRADRFLRGRQLSQASFVPDAGSGEGQEEPLKSRAVGVGRAFAVEHALF